METRIPSPDSNLNSIKANFKVYCDASTTELELHFTYNDSEEHQEVMKKIFSLQKYFHQGRWYSYYIGMLRNHMIEKKFHAKKTGDDPTIEKSNGQELLTLTFDVSQSDDLLRTLSLIHDAISLFKPNNIIADYSLFDIINEFDKAYTANNLNNHECAVIIKQLIGIKSANHLMHEDDMICLLYAFNALKSFDRSLFTQQINFSQFCDEMLPVIKKLLHSLALSPQPKDKEPLTPEKLESQHIDQPKEKEPLTPEELELQKKLKLQHTELNEFVSRINLWQRIKLFRPCLGMKADDGGEYHWNYTEWFFLSRAKLTYVKGIMSIDIDPEKNSAYKKEYAPGSRNHAILGKELLALANPLNLSYAIELSKPDSPEWHKKITFTRECSTWLSDMKLHLDLDTIKLKIKANNNYLFFQHACKSGNFTLKTLPSDIVKMIFALALGPVQSLEKDKTQLLQGNEEKVSLKLAGLN